jgi:hypothetical protein
MYVMARGAQHLRKRIGRVDVVINDQDAKTRARRCLVAANRRGAFARVHERRQTNDKFTTLVRPVATGLDVAAMQFDQSPHQR